MFERDRSETGVAMVHVARSEGTALSNSVEHGYGSLGPVGSGDGQVANPLSPAILLRYRWSIVLIGTLLAAPAISAIWMLLEPSFRAQSVIRIAPKIPRLVFDTEDNGVVPFYQGYVNTQEAVMRSPLVLERVLDQSDVRETDWYRRLTGGYLLELGDALLIAPRPKTELVDLYVTTKNAADSAVIANAIVDQYIRFNQERASLGDDEVYQRLMEQYKLLENDIKGRKDVIDLARKELGTGTPQELVAGQRLRLDQADAQLQDLRRRLSLAEWQASELEQLQQERAARESSGEVSADVVKRAAYEDDADWRKLFLDLRTAEHRVEVEGGRLGDAHPKMIEYKKAIGLAREMLQSRESQLDAAKAVASIGVATPGAVAPTPGITTDIDSLRWQVKALKKEEELLVKTYDTQRQAFEKTFETARTLDHEMDVLKHKEEMFAAIRARKDEKELESNVPGSISLQSRAMAPNRPHQDRRLLLTAVAMIAACGAAVGQAFVRARFSQAIHEPGAVSGASVPFLGHMPFVRRPETPSAEEQRVQHESMRMVRTALLQRLPNRAGNAIVVTSAGPSAGKTSIAVLLSKSLAQSGKRVLLVDADLRRPAVAKRMGIDGKVGLVDVLAGRMPDSAVIVPNGVAKLDILPAGVAVEAASDDAEALATGGFSELLQRWRKAYDVVVLDSSPVLPVADARILACMADGVTMVVREKHCRRTDVFEAMACLGAAGGKLLGTVFVGSQRRGGYYAGYYDSYGPQPELVMDARSA